VKFRLIHFVAYMQFESPKYSVDSYSENPVVRMLCQRGKLPAPGPGGHFGRGKRVDRCTDRASLRNEPAYGRLRSSRTQQRREV